MQIVTVPAYDIKYSDNIEWFGNLYTVLEVVPDYEDGTVWFKVGYPRKLSGDFPVLNEITTQLAKNITVRK